MENAFLQLNKITKSFPGVKALNSVDFEVYKGEVHAICGENGAGKSTLINVLAGNYKPDEGTIKIDSKEVVFKNHSDSINEGISVVYQERSLVPNLDVAENIYVDRQPKTKLGLIDRKKMFADTRAVCDQIQLSVKPDEIVGNISPAEQQMVEIAKAMAINCKLIIFDEPTAALSEKETAILFSLIKDIKKRGISIIYISHRLEEIFKLADRVTVLKDGKYVNTKNVADTNMDELVRMMAGRDLVYDEYTSHSTEEIVLETKKLCGERFRDISFQLHRGEILGLAGLAGSGRTEVFRAIMGADKISSGEIFVEGKKIKVNGTESAIKNGIGYLPEDRKDQGLFIEMSIADNIISGNLDAAIEKGLISKKKTYALADEYKNILSIATPDVKKIVGELSGGNQQKVVFAKWLLVNPKILIVDEPTRGVDVGSKSEIYRIIRKLAAEGTSIVAISSDLPEILTISDRILVMHQGRISGSCNHEEISEELIMRYASGLENKEDIR